jgi:hypothetical protein
MEVTGLFEPGGVRGALGHVLPGMVTLLAVALALSPLLGQPLSSDVIRDIWATYGWLSALMLALAGYVAGTLQFQLLAWLEGVANKSSTRFSRESLANTAIEKFGMRDQWEGTARQHFNKIPPSGSEPTWLLWRLCDYHVLHADPRAHDTYMGRYNAQYILFANLAISTLFLCLAIWVIAVLRAAFPACVPYSAYQMSRLLIASAALVLVAVPVMLVRADRCRRDFVERVFPIFYVIVTQQAKNRAANKPMHYRVLAGLGRRAAAFVKALVCGPETSAAP